MHSKCRYGFQQQKSSLVVISYPYPIERKFCGAIIMSKQQSRAVEILPGKAIETLYGSMKHCSCRVTKNGRNIAIPKVKQPTKEGRNPEYFKKGSEKWRGMTVAEKDFWKAIATEKAFWSKWTAFMSSFLLSIGLHGLDYTMTNALIYYDSDARLQRQKNQEKTLARRRRYVADPQYYPQTEDTMKNYPLAFDSELIHVRLLDVNDVNNALICRLIYRTDPIVEYQFFPEKAGFPAVGSEVETGYYIKTTRPRLDNELYRLFSKEAVAE